MFALGRGRGVVSNLESLCWISLKVSWLALCFCCKFNMSAVRRLGVAVMAVNTLTCSCLRSVKAVSTWTTRVSMFPTLAINGWVADWNISNVSGVFSWLPRGLGQGRLAPGLSTSTSMVEDGVWGLLAIVARFARVRFRYLW